MGSASDGQYLYILGGQDLNHGLYNSLWRINIQYVKDDITKAAWELIQVRGEPPKGVSHCSMFVN